MFEEKVTEVTKNRPQTLPLQAQIQITLSPNFSQRRRRVPQLIPRSDSHERLVLNAATQTRTAQNGGRPERIGETEKVC